METIIILLITAALIYLAWKFFWKLLDWIAGLFGKTKYTIEEIEDDKPQKTTITTTFEMPKELSNWVMDQAKKQKKPKAVFIMDVLYEKRNNENI